MNKKRTDKLLSNAVNLLRETGLEKKAICKKLGMTEKEFDSIGKVDTTDERYEKSARKAIGCIKRMKDGAGRLGYDVKEVDYFETEEGRFCDSYGTVGGQLLEVVNKYPESLRVIEETLIAITGYSFSSMLDRMKRHKRYWDNLF